jgi:hypothetical protein
MGVACFFVAEGVQTLGQVSGAGPKARLKNHGIRVNHVFLTSEA